MVNKNDPPYDMIYCNICWEYINFSDAVKHSLCGSNMCPDCASLCFCAKCDQIILKNCLISPMPYDKDCPICYTPFTKSSEVFMHEDCGVMFCKKCIRNWIRNECECPICKKYAQDDAYWLKVNTKKLFEYCEKIEEPNEDEYIKFLEDLKSNGVYGNVSGTDFPKCEISEDYNFEDNFEITPLF